LVTGLKAGLYLDGREGEHWNFQSPPIPKHQLGKPVKCVDALSNSHLPNFGPARDTRAQQWEKECVESAGKVSIEPSEQPVIRPAPPSATPKISDVIGRAVDKFGPYNRLNNKEHVVALVDEDMCINCGKCYMTCNDTGYQAIDFDPKTHFPFVREADCTGCALCFSVCPIPDCIRMVERESPYVPNRGIPPTSIP
uniref:Dihydropyrimidine dehydrogenase n=1 Tax=Mesocestoides corti TaxID=53468 RepID=A0A5K3EXJ8_MESCO